MSVKGVAFFLVERLGGALMGWVEKGKRRIRACQDFWVAYCLNSLPLGPTENSALNLAAAVVLKFSMLLLFKTLVEIP